MLYQRLSAAALLLTLLTGILASCGSTGKFGETSDETTMAPTTQTETAPAETGPIASYLPEQDLEGYALRFATYAKDNGKYFYSEEATGDVVNDAVYDAINLVSEKYNATFTVATYGNTSGEVSDFVTKAVQAGDDAFDLVNGHDCTMWSLSLKGLFKNVRELEYQDFTQPWYPQYANDQYEIGGKQYIFSSYLSYQSLGWTKVLLINKAIADEFSLAVPYDDVHNGTWTLDKLLTMSASVYKDLNGNSQQDDADQYGFIGYKKLYGFQSSFVSCYAVGDDGLVTLNYDKERFIDVVTKMNTLLNGGEGGYLIGNEPDTKLFINGQGLFYYDNLSILTDEAMRASEVNYGILPVPKYNETQKNYLSPSFDCQFAVPVTAQNSETISLLIEALSSVGYNKVRDVYFETALSTKYTRDEESIDMLRIIGDTMNVDLAYLNTAAGIDGMGRAFMYCFSNPNAGVSSYLESITSKEQATIDKLNKFFGE